MENIEKSSHAAAELNPAPGVALQQNHKSQLITIRTVEHSEPVRLQMCLGSVYRISIVKVTSILTHRWASDSTLMTPPSSSH